MIFPVDCNVPVTNDPAVVPKYTPVSAIEVTACAVDVGVVEVPSRYAFVVVPNVTLTLVSVLLSAGNVIVLVLAAVTCPAEFIVTYGTENVPPWAGDALADGPNDPVLAPSDG